MRAEINKAIRIAGSREALAHLARCTGRTLENWLSQGRVPKTPARLIELELDGRVKARRLEKEDG